jgi:hypothetical protein
MPLLVEAWLVISVCVSIALPLYGLRRSDGSREC